MIYISYQVYFDEINTSSCLGLLKEIIIDGTIDGEVMLHTAS